MSDLMIRQAHRMDARQMADLLGQIIAIGGTTALTGPITAEMVVDWMDSASGRSAWHVAEDDSGRILGFQWIEPADYLPPGTAEIATFVVPGRHGLGIGSKLFEATKDAARALGYESINANIREDNPLGLAYYQSRGFEDHGRILGHLMADGQVVDKRLKRFDLR